MALSITGGQLRGRRLHAPKGDGVRPTSAKVREALFSILGQDRQGDRVLDLFAGTGALGIEAASRGAERVVFVEQSREHLRTLSKNVEILAGLCESVVRQGDALRAPALLAQGGERFDLVFLDPPYRKGLAAQALAAIASVSTELLSANAVVVAETDDREELEFTVGELSCSRARSYGESKIWIYEPQRGEEE